MENIDEKYNVDKFKKYIDTSKCEKIIITDVVEYYVKNNIILQKQNMFFNKDYFYNIYEYGEDLENLKYKQGIPNAFLVHNGKIERIFFRVNKNLNYNPEGPSSITYFSSNTVIKSIEYTNKYGNTSRVDGPAYSYRLTGNGKFFHSNYVNNIYLTNGELKKITETVVSGKLCKNINRYNNKRKLEICREIAVFYKMKETIEAIDNKLMVLKLQGRV